MDYVDFIVHVFSAEKRAYYGLERLRKTATILSVAELSAEIKAAIAATRVKKPTAKKAVKAAPVKAAKVAPVKAAAKKAHAKAAKKAVKAAVKTAKKSSSKK